MESSTAVCVQMPIDWEDKPANRERVRRYIELPRPPAGSLVVLPEMFATGFSMNVEKIALGEPEETVEFLRGLAIKHGITVVGGFVTQDGDGMGRNEAVAVDPTGEVTARFAKLHPFSYGGEASHFRGGEGIVLFRWNGVTVAPFICYDLRFPEAFRAAAIGGAEMFVVIANWPSRREEHWTVLLRARAIENQAYVMGVNRVGRDPNTDYSGRSMVVDPKGVVLADADSEEGVVSAAIEVESLREYRRDFPALQDIRSEFRNAIGVPPALSDCR